MIEKTKLLNIEIYAFLSRSIFLDYINDKKNVGLVPPNVKSWFWVQGDFYWNMDFFFVYSRIRRVTRLK